MPSKLAQNWVFMVGPMLGGVLAGLIFNAGYLGYCEEEKQEDCECDDDEEKQGLKEN